jgi:hypothetical protein
MRRVAIIVILVSLAAHGEIAGDAPPSSIIYPAQELPVSFDHAAHLAGGASCVDCHTAAESSTRSADDLIPRPEACAACHHDRDVTSQLARVVVPPPNLKFNHQLHVRQQIRCKECHGDLEKEGVHIATRLQLPKMSLCLGCHDGAKAPSACATCHLTQPDGRLVTDFPDGKLAPSGQIAGDAHDASWNEEHRHVAAAAQESCMSCHKQSDCVNCHQGTTRPLAFHQNDYLTYHPVEARRNDPDCSSCHRLQTFCTGCHARTGVNADPVTSEFQKPKFAFHPSDWVTDLANPLRHATDHSYQAQRNIRACASCHREDFCATAGCHRDTVSPHPNDWKGSGRCKALAARDGRMCLRCHSFANQGEPCESPY